MKNVIIGGLAVVVLLGCQPQNQTLSTMQNKKANVVEITTFKLNDGVAKADFEKAAATMQQEFLAGQPGFIKRTLTVAADSTWTDIIYWQDQASAEKTMQIAEKSEVVFPFMQKINYNSVTMKFTEPVEMQ